MDTAVLRGVRGTPLVVHDNVMVGPRSHLSGCRIERNAFIATGSSIFNGAVIGEASKVRINAIVHLRTVLAPGTTVPIGWIAVGDPARLFPPDKHQEIWEVQQTLDFPKYVFGIDRPVPGRSMMPEVMPRYAAALGRHRNDVAVG